MITMKETQNIPAGAVSERSIMHSAVFIAALVLLYILLSFYTHAVMMQDQEIAALLAALYILGGVYLGRYLTQAWVHTRKVVPTWIFILLIGIIIACVIWLFAHAGFPLRSSNSLNLLLLAFPLLLLSVAAGTLIKLTRTTIARQLQAAKAQAEHSRSELNLLQSQLSPHFLFNTLNNMYGISITQPEKVPPLLLKLSDLLRYSVYDVKELFVPLKSEIAYLRNYIEFERLRIGERLVLNASIEDVTDDRITIAPMLLIVFLENAFKHSKNTAEKDIFIDITLKTRGDSILFSVKNSHTRRTDESTMTKKDSGLGLANVRQRLTLLYPDAYQLDIQSEESVYSVRLQLKAKRYA